VRHSVLAICLLKAAPSSQHTQAYLLAVDAHQEQAFRAALGPGSLKLLAVARLEWLDALPRMHAGVARVRHACNTAMVTFT
jgi:hypothetical protein